MSFNHKHKEVDAQFVDLKMYNLILYIFHGILYSTAWIMNLHQFSNIEMFLSNNYDHIYLS